jgi:hypothetical protein
MGKSHENGKIRGCKILHPLFFQFSWLSHLENSVDGFSGTFCFGLIVYPAVCIPRIDANREQQPKTAMVSRKEQSEEDYDDDHS